MLSLENAYVAANLRSLIFHSLDNDLLHNALFHAGRLHGLDPRNGDANHLLALCHFRLGQYRAAYDFTKERGSRGLHLGCSFIFAQACLALQKFLEGAEALERSKPLWAPRNNWNKHSESTRRHLPDSAAAAYLLGKLWLSYGDVTKAIECFVDSLKTNPFMWESFSELCKAGANMKVSNVFKMTSEMLSASDQIHSSSSHLPNHQNFNLHQPASQNPSSAHAQLIFEPTNQPRPLQVNTKISNNNFFAATTPGNDPFNSKSRALNTTQMENDLRGPNHEWDTPVSNGANAVQPDDDVTMDDGDQSANEAPPAPARKSSSRILYAFQHDNISGMPKMRSITTRSKSRVGPESNDLPQDTIRPTSIPISHKRTVSGQAPSDPSGAPSRRSDRLLRTRLVPARFAAAVARDNESGDKKRDILRRTKTLAVTSKLKSVNSTSSNVGRIVSGNGSRKDIDANDREGKDGRYQHTRDVGAMQSFNTGPAAPSNSTSGIARRDLVANKEALSMLLDQYGKIGQAFYSLARYDCSNALRQFNHLSKEFRETPLVLSHIGRAHFENASYAEAEKCFSRVKKLVPSRTEDMEIYSTVLWHLKRDVDLSYLSYELIELDRLSPQAWCALGNAFSLQAEHDKAVKCFRRATQLDPAFAYAYTLTGHEFVVNEEFDKALLAYRNAISADNRHYNGWYGLGQVYEKLGNYDIARDHYRNAAIINPSNPVLKVCIGLVLEKTVRSRSSNRMEKNQLREVALQMYDEACSLDPKAYRARFCKARLLLTLKRHDEALDELETLQNLYPDDAPVHFRLGEMYMRFEDKRNAIRHLTIAMNLDPKAANLCKEALSRLGEDHGDEYDDSSDEYMDST